MADAQQCLRRTLNTEHPDFTRVLSFLPWLTMVRQLRGIVSHDVIPALIHALILQRILD